MPTKAREYVRRANHALTLAAQADDALVRETLISVAETWLSMAEDAAREAIEPAADRGDEQAK